MINTFRSKRAHSSHLEGGGSSCSGMDILPKIRKRLKELRRHGPILKIANLLHKKRASTVRASLLLDKESILKSIGPVKTKVGAHAGEEVARIQIQILVEDEALAQRWPGEEVRRDGVVDAQLQRAGPLPFRHATQVLDVWVEEVADQHVALVRDRRAVDLGHWGPDALVHLLQDADAGTQFRGWAQ